MRIDFGAGKIRSFFPIHEMIGNIGEYKAQVSFLPHMTKDAAWKVWSLFGDVAPTFKALSQQPTFTQIQDALPTTERVTVLL